MEQSSNRTSCLKRFVHKYLPLGKQKWPNVIRYITLVAGSLGMALAGMNGTLSAWNNAVRAIWNQTESETNMMIQCGTIGAVLAFPSGKLWQLWGTQAVCLIGGSFAIGSYILLTLAVTVWRDLFANQMWLSYLVWGVNGFACIFLYFASLIGTIQNFPSQHQGKVVGLLGAAYNLLSIILIVIYNSCFTNGFIDPGQEGKQNVSGFFVLLTVISSSITVCLVLFTGRVEIPEDVPINQAVNEDHLAPIVEHDELEAGEGTANSLAEADITTTNEEKSPPNLFSEYPFKEITPKEAFCRWNFYFCLLQYAFMLTAGTTFTYNFATILRSYDLNQYNTLFTVSSAVFGAFTQIACGLLSDLISKNGKAPRSATYLIPYALQTVSFIVCAFFGYNMIVLYITTLTIAIAQGAAKAVSPSVLGELFGNRYMAILWGFTWLASCALGFPYAIVFSSIYEAGIYQPGDIYCYGQACFTWSYVLLAGTSLCAFIMALGLTQNMFDNAAVRKKAIGHRG